MKSWGKFYSKIKNLSPVTILWISIAVLCIVSALSLGCGAVSVLPSGSFFESDIVRYVRVPRILAAIATGAGLAGGGVIIQTLLANPLAGPNVIGMNSGAGFMALLCSILFPFTPILQPVFSFVGSLLTILFVYWIASYTGTSKLTLLLSGIILNSLLGAFTEALYTLHPDTLISIAEFRAGGLSSVQTNVLYPAMALIAFSILLVYRRSNILELLSLGDETAHSLGLSVSRYRFFFLICAACMVGAAVSFAGLIGFLGLIVPHAARLIVGDEIRYLFPLSIVWGSILLVLCDMAARTMFAPFEMPVGILLSILGAPVFLYLLLKKNKR